MSPNFVNVMGVDGMQAVSTVPSFNKTPGPGTPPLPYPVTNSLESRQGTVATVVLSGEPAFVLGQSNVPTCMGDMAGALGGVVSGVVGGKIEAIQGSPDVLAGGNPVVRSGDPCTLQGGNTIGIFVPIPGIPVVIQGGVPSGSMNP